MALNNLQEIRTKVRRLTRSPSTAQLSDDDIDQYVNTFILYDFPEHLRLFSLRTTLKFFTQPGVDTYQTSANVFDPLYNFQNQYIAIHQPVYIAGIPASFTQWKNVFFGKWPNTNYVINTLIATGGSAGPFTGIINSFPPNYSQGMSRTGAILQHSLILSALDVNNNAMVIVDYPSTVSSPGGINPHIGYLGQPNFPQDNANEFGQINYVTGQFTVTFPDPTLVASYNTIRADYIPYIPGLPIDMLYYDNKFILRPVPDKVYSVTVEADIRPTELILSNDIPKIEQWWQLFAYGAAKKVFEDRMDMDSVQMIMPEYRNQMNFVNRTSLEQQANERTTTIYTEGRSYGWGWYNNNFPF